MDLVIGSLHADMTNDPNMQDLSARSADALRVSEVFLIEAKVFQNIRKDNRTSLSQRKAHVESVLDRMQELSNKKKKTGDDELGVTRVPHTSIKARAVKFCVA